MRKRNARIFLNTAKEVFIKIVKNAFNKIRNAKYEKAVHLPVRVGLHQSGQVRHKVIG